MTEAERRRTYVATRVLIDSAKILETTFDDGDLYFTGEQIELMRNLMQYANRIDSYVSEYEPGYYLTPDDTDWDSIQAIVADLEEVLMGNPNTIWGFTARWSGSDEGTSIGEAYTDCGLGPVPAGYVYVIEHWSFIHHDTQTRACVLVLTGGDPEQIVYYAPNVAQEDFVYDGANLTLAEGDGIMLRVFALANTLTSELSVWGHIMTVP